MRSRRTSENPITALSGVRSSWDMLARNSDLCRLATSSSARLAFQLAEQAGVEDGQRRLAGERLQQLARLLGEAARRPSAHHQGAHDASFTQHRDRHERSPTGLLKRFEMRVRRLVTQVRHLERVAAPPRPARPTCRRGRSGSSAAAPGVRALVPYAARTWNRSSSNSSIEPPSVPDRWTAWVTMRSRTSSRSRLELTAWPISPRASSCSTFWPSSCWRSSRARTSRAWRMAMAAWAANVVRTSVSRSPNGIHLHPPHQQHPDQFAVELHRGAQDGAQAREPLQVEPPVVGVREDVGDLLRTAVEGDPTDQRPAVGTHRVPVP